MIRMLVVGYCYGIRSERCLCEEVNLNLAYRWFCRLGLEDVVPNYSTFSKNRHGRYWLDLGNTEASAQVVLGQGPRRENVEANLRLPCVTELFPELLDASVPDDNRPTCLVRVSLASQGLFINDVAVRFAAQLLYELFSKGRLNQQAW
jgi:PRTRC genetic system ThiF family protein